MVGLEYQSFGSSDSSSTESPGINLPYYGDKSPYVSTRPVEPVETWRPSTLPPSPVSPTRAAPKLPPRPKPQVPKKSSHLRRTSTGPTQQSQIASQHMGHGFTKDDIIIAVMGVTGAGKSTFISLLAEGGEDIKIGHGLQSCTSTVDVYHFTYQGKRVFLVDTPGFDDTNRSDSEILKDVAFWLAAAYSNQTQLAGIIYLHRICDVKMGGAAMRNLRMFKQLCGANNLSSVMLVTTHWTSNEGVTVNHDVAQARLNELKGTDGFWGGMIDRGSKVVKHNGSKASALEIVAALVQRRSKVVLDIQRQLVDEKKDLDDTEAAQQLQAELIEERRKFQQHLEDLKDDMKFAMQENDQKWLGQIEADKKLYESKIQKTYDETEALKTNLKKISEEKDAQLRALQFQMKKQQEQYEKQINETTESMKRFEADAAKKHEAYERQRQDFMQRAEQREKEYQDMMAENQRRMNEEKNDFMREQLAAQREAAERQHQFQVEQAERRAEEQQRQFEMQQEQDRRWRQEMEEKQERLEKEKYQIQREATKRAWYNPAGWFGGRYTM